MRTIFAIILLTNALIASSQQTTTKHSITLNLPDLPKLQTFIDSALARAPMVNYQVERAVEAEHLIKSARRHWSDYVGAESYYRYGRLGVIGDGNQTGGGSNVPIVTSSSQQQNWWYVGAFIRIPLFELLNRGVEIKRLKTTVRQAEYLQQDAADATTMRVIELYNKVRLNLELLESKAILLETNNAQVTEAELQYKNRKIDLGRLAQLHEMQTKVASEFATARYEARSALAQLQALSGIKIFDDLNFKIVQKDNDTY